MNIDKEWEKKRSCFYNFKCILKIRLYLIVANQHIRDLTLKISLKYKIWMNYCFKFWDGFWVWLGDVDWTRGSACTSWLSPGEQWTSLPHWPAVQGAWFGQWKVCSSDVCHFLLEALKSSLCLSMIDLLDGPIFEEFSKRQRKKYFVIHCGLIRSLLVRHGDAMSVSRHQTSCLRWCFSNQSFLLLFDYSFNVTQAAVITRVFSTVYHSNSPVAGIQPSDSVSVPTLPTAVRWHPLTGTGAFVFFILVPRLYRPSSQ